MRRTIDSHSEVIAWALGKLADELSFYLTNDKIRKGKRNASTLREYKAVTDTRDKFLRGDIVIAGKATKNA